MDPIQSLATELDPALLMPALGMEPDAWQRDVLRATDARLLMLCARQCGKSTVAGILGLHTAMFRPDSLVLLLSPSQRQSGEIFRKIVGFYEDLGRPVPAEQATATTLFLANGSRIVSLPGSPETVRGFSSPQLVILDEAALSDDGLYTAAAPMVAVSRGRILGISSPFGRRGWFHEQWGDPHSQWRKVMVTAADCPRIDPAFLAEQKLIMGDWQYRQEFECEFVASDNQTFPTPAILAAFNSTRPPLFSGSLLE